MKFLMKITRHTKLVTAMANRLGIDFGAYLQKDPGTVSEYRGAILTCMKCEHVGDCHKFLAGTDQVDEAPDYCLNKTMLDALVVEDIKV